MFARRLGVVGVIAASVLTLATQSAYATGGGTNRGDSGVVFNNVSVGGITFTGTCDYFINSTGLTINGQDTAAGTNVSTTSITCRVDQGTFSTSVFGGPTTGTAASITETGLPPFPGTAVCITMSAFTTAARTVSTGEFCVSSIG